MQGWEEQSATSCIGAYRSEPQNILDNTTNCPGHRTRGRLPQSRRTRSELAPTDRCRESVRLVAQPNIGDLSGAHKNFRGLPVEIWTAQRSDWYRKADWEAPWWVVDLVESPDTQRMGAFP